MESTDFPAKSVLANQRFIFAAKILACVLPMLFVLYSLLPAKDAWWSIIDDHRKMYILEVEHGLPISAVLHHFWHAVDFAPLGSATRVQPIYHVIWGLELHFWGLDVQYWYLTRIACALGFAGALALALTRLVGPLASALATLAVVHAGFYSEVFLRLGTQESYIAPALATAFLIGIMPGPRQQWAQFAIATLYLCPLVVAFGSKEIALIFVPLVAVQAWLDYRRTGITSPRLWAGLLGLAFAAFVIVFMLLGLRGQTVDTYGRDLSIAGRVLLLVRSDYMHGMLPVAAGIALVAPLIAFVLVRWFPRYNGIRPLLQTLAVSTVLLVGAYVGSLVFYNLSIPPGSHYEFPTYPLYQALVFIGASAGIMLLLVFLKPESAKRCAFVTAAIILLFLQLVRQPAFWQLRINAEQTKIKTHAFEQKFKALLKMANSEPDRPIEFISHGYNDFEPVHSVLRFLRGYGAKNQLILNTGALAQIPVNSSWEAYLRNLMLGIKPKAGEFSQVVSGPPAADSIRIYFSKSELSDGAVANFWPM